jgi:alpha-glucuronidase
MPLGSLTASLVPNGGVQARLATVLLLVLSMMLPPAQAEDGSELWLRYRPLPEAHAQAWRAAIEEVVYRSDTPTGAVIRAELQRGLGGLLGAEPKFVDEPGRAHSLLLGTPESQPALAALRDELAALGSNGYLIRPIEHDGRRVLAVAGHDEIGLLYASYHLLRLLQAQRAPDALDVREAPGLQRRLLNHWDNLDRTVERGYAGFSIWDWHRLPDWLDPRYTDYARANASLGINGTVLNNVNTNALSLTPMYLDKAAALAGVFRPYGIRVYLSARFSAPKEVGGLDSADPLDPAVRAWWQAKAAEIYRVIPDFGGFLVKANSEGQPGPQDYGRSHADGANMLAEALAPHGGIVMWRAFVYLNEQPEDRAKQAWNEFVPLDGKFRDNVIVQVKNGAIDFQPREPFHPLFGAMPNTPLMMEFQITKEYLGFSTHLAYLGALYEEALQSDTFINGEGSTVARVIDGSLHAATQPQPALTGIAGVANIGTDRNWSGSIFDQANWYAFGRLAWNPHLSARDIAEEWVRSTFGNDPAPVEPVVAMMMGSHQAVVDYMTPLGLHHLMGRGHHYGPGPWVEGGPRADWTSVYFHRADADGIGFDRSRSGSDAVSQYAPPLAARFNDPKQVPEAYLLWFHHLPWDWRMASGRSLWDELVLRYDRGVAKVKQMRHTWAALSPYVDAERHAQIAAFLVIQQNEAQWWRDASIAYFQSLSKRPLPDGQTAPPHPLEHYQSLAFPHAPGHW